MFSEDEQLKMREAAYSISAMQNLEAQSWDDAWAGKYSEEPSEEQLESNYRALEKMALDIKSGGDGYTNYDIEEQIKMIWLDDIFHT